LIQGPAATPGPFFILRCFVTMPEFPVSAEKVAALYADFLRLGIREEDLDEQFIRSGGNGGQNVNKVSTCAVIVHRPSGLMVRCQQERSQGLNRFLARRLLADKVAEKITGEISKKRAEAEKVRRQKRKRSKRAKQKMLENKRFHGQKKAGRARVSDRGE
jgi:protein subunit release factor B